jgi:O-antigen/teichoic acid export membrane protein
MSGKMLFRETLFYGLGRMVGRLFIFLLLPLLSYHFTPTEYGSYEIFTILASCVMALALCGMNEAVFFFYFKSGEEQKNRPLSAALIFWLVMTAIQLLLITLLAVPVSIALTGGNSAGLCLPAALSGSLDGLFILLSMPFRLEKKPIQFGLVSLFQTGLALFFTYIFVYRLNFGVSGAFWGIAAGNFLVCLPLLFVALARIGVKPDKKLFIDMLKYGLPFLPVFLFTLVYTVSDRWIVRLFLGIDETGIYGAAYRTASLVLLCVTALRFAWVPNMYELHSKGLLYKQLGKILAATSAFMCLAATGYALFVREIHGILVGTGYEAGILIAPLIGFAYYFDGLSQIAESPLYCEKKTSAIPLIVFLGAALNFTINIIFIPSFGIMAAAVSTLGAYFLMFVLYSLRAWKVASYDFPYWTVFRHVALIIAACAVNFVPVSFFLRAIAFIVVMIALMPDFLAMRRKKNDDT